MRNKITSADITQEMYDAFVEVVNEGILEEPLAFYNGAKIYANLHVDEPIGRADARRWRSGRACGLRAADRRRGEEDTHQLKQDSTVFRRSLHGKTLLR